MDIHLKIGEVIKIVGLIPKAFQVTHLSVSLSGNIKAKEIKIYFSNSKNELETGNFSNLDYMEFKPDPTKPKQVFKPSFNTVDKVYDFCIVVADNPSVLLPEIVMHYKGL